MAPALADRDRVEGERTCDLVRVRPLGERRRDREVHEQLVQGEADERRASLGAGEHLADARIHALHHALVLGVVAPASPGLVSAALVAGGRRCAGPIRSLLVAACEQLHRQRSAQALPRGGAEGAGLACAGEGESE